jgi:hypothetical protein
VPPVDLRRIGQTFLPEALDALTLAIQPGPLPLAPPGQIVIYALENGVVKAVDGTGTHSLHLDAFAEISGWSFTPVLVAMPNVAELVPLTTVYQHNGRSDEYGHLIPQFASGTIERTLDDLALTEEGEIYQDDFFLAVTAAAAGGRYVFVSMVALDGSLINITAATNAIPIEITTFIDHNLMDGDIVVIEGGTGNTAVNGSFIFERTPATTDQGTLRRLDGADSVGNGAYNPGSANITVAGDGGGVVLVDLSGSDIQAIHGFGRKEASPANKAIVYAGNISNANGLDVHHARLTSVRIGD